MELITKLQEWNQAIDAIGQKVEEAKSNKAKTI